MLYNLNLSSIDKNIMTSSIRKTFGELIRQLRKEKMLTLTQLAAQVSLDSANLSKIETGKREFDEKKLDKLAKALDQDVNFLKRELLSESIAKKIYKNDEYQSILELAESKVNYYKQSNIEQGKIQFT